MNSPPTTPDKLREAFELMCHIDMTRYTWTGSQYVHKYDPSQTVRADRVNTLFEGFIRGADWADANNRVKS